MFMMDPVPLGWYHGAKCKVRGDDTGRKAGYNACETYFTEAYPCTPPSLLSLAIPSNTAIEWT
jgi:hypothetical protein